MQTAQQPAHADAAQETNQALIGGGIFARAVMTLLGGNILAQLIPYFATILLAHQFAPAAFGYLALFTSIASTVSILATGRYELAVLLPAQENDAKALIFFSASLAFIVSIVMSFVIVCLSSLSIFSFTLTYAVLTLPVVVFFIAVYQLLIQWFLRRGRYPTISFARLIQAASTVVVSCALGWFGYERGLIMGYVFGWIVGVLFLLIMVYVTDTFKPFPSTNDMIKNATRFSDHVIYGAIPGLFDALSLVALVFIINLHYGSDYAGQYNLSNKFIYAPISLIAGAIAQVIFRESSLRIQQKKCIKPLFKKVTCYLTYLAFIYAIVLMLCAPQLFDVCLGSAWHVSGQLAVILAAGYGVRLVASTLSVFLLAHNALRVNGLWQGCYFIVISALYFFNPSNPLDFFLCLAVIDVLMFGVYFFLIRRVVYQRPMNALI